MPLLLHTYIVRIYYSVCFNRLIGTKVVWWRHCELISSWHDLTFFVKMYTNNSIVETNYYLLHTGNYHSTGFVDKKKDRTEFYRILLDPWTWTCEPRARILYRKLMAARVSPTTLYDFGPIIQSVSLTPINWTNSVTTPCTCTSRTSCYQPKVVQEPEMWASRGREWLCGVEWLTLKLLAVCLSRNWNHISKHLGSLLTIRISGVCLPNCLPISFVSKLSLAFGFTSHKRTAPFQKETC